MSLAHTWRTKKNHIFPLFYKPCRSKLMYKCLINTWLECKIKFFECFLPWKSRLLNPTNSTTIFFEYHLFLEKRFEKVVQRNMVFNSFLSQLLKRTIHSVQ